MSHPDPDIPRCSQIPPDLRRVFVQFCGIGSGGMVVPLRLLSTLEDQTTTPVTRHSLRSLEANVKTKNASSLPSSATFDFHQKSKTAEDSTDHPTIVGAPHSHLWCTFARLISFASFLLLLLGGTSTVGTMGMHGTNMDKTLRHDCEDSPEQLWLDLTSSDSYTCYTMTVELDRLSVWWIPSEKRHKKT